MSNDIAAIQFELWQDCDNNCEFCYLKKNRILTSVEQKIENINKVLSIIRDDKLMTEYNAVALIGGEFFQGQLNSLDNSLYSKFMELIGELKWQLSMNKIRQVWITASLLSPDVHHLFSVLDALTSIELNENQKIILCTSWDTKGRFHTQEQLDSWYQHVAYISNRFSKIEVHVQTIMTQEFIDDILENGWEWYDKIGNNKVSVDFKPPFIATADIEFGKTTLSEYMETIQKTKEEFPAKFFIDDRNKYLKFLQMVAERFGVDALKRFGDPTIRSKSINHLDLGTKIDNRFDVDSIENVECGHPIDSYCYLNDNHCCRCDAQNLYETMVE